jgi:PAS domain S-box-containing protein
MALLESVLALRRSEAKSRALIEAIPDGIARVRVDGQIIDFKPNSEFSPPMFDAYVIGKNLADVLPEDFATLALATMNEAVTSGQSQVVEYQFPIHGRMCDYEARTVAAPDDETITLFREITERKAAERLNREFTETILQQKEELERVNRKLQQTDRVKATFTAMLAHDIRSPLTSLRMALDFFQNRHAFSEEELGESIDSARESLQRVLTLTNDLLEVFRSETDEVFLLRGVVSAEALLGKCLREARLQAFERKIQLTTEIEVEFPLFIGDEGKLERVFANLLSNAVKFTPEGGRVTLRASLETENFERWMIVQVADTGEGIAEDELPFIFDPYRQAMSKQRSLGVGLGLAIAQRIVTAHGGTIKAASRRGEGSTFTVRIPLKG